MLNVLHIRPKLPIICFSCPTPIGVIAKMKRATRVSKRVVVALMLLVVLLGMPWKSLAQGKTFYWEQFDVDITLQENGDLFVVETQTLNFSSGTFSFGFRGIPVGTNGRNDGIRDVAVSEAGVAFAEAGSNIPGTFEVERTSNEDVINWYFEPTAGRHTYQISYTVLGAVRVGSADDDAGDQIFWKPTPVDLPARIARSVVTLHLPEGIRPQQFTGTTDYLVAAYVDGSENAGVEIDISEDVRTIRYDNRAGIIPGEVFEIRAQFPHGQLSIPVSDWQERERRGDAISLVTLAVAILLGLGGPLLVLLLWYSAGRDPETGVVVPEYVTEPPDDLPPGLVGTLVDEKADMRDIVSTLLDLAQRGYLTISEEERNHVFKRTDSAEDDLRPYEKRFIQFVFGKRKERSLKSLQYKFAKKLPELRRLLYEELQSEELVPKSPESVRGSYGCASWIILVAAVGSFFALPAVLGETVATAVCPAFAIGLTGIVLLITSRHMPVKSKKGVVAAARWEAFKTFLKNAERYRELDQATDIFEKYLAYATAFGLERGWIRKFSAVPATPIPHWYGPYYGTGYGRHRGSRGLARRGGTSGAGSPPSLEGMADGIGGGLQSMSDGLGRMLSSTATILRSTPPSSSSGSGGGFSGGFSGGSSGGGGSAGFG
jgi:hypothetical protein